MMRKVNIMPMAGDGKRFKDSGYKIIKPLIKKKDIEIFIHSAKSIPDADFWIFIIRKEHNINGVFKKIIKKYFKNYKIILTAKKTEGQASSCLLAKKYLRFDDSITICSCDIKFKINKIKYYDLLCKSDAVIFTTNQNKIAIKNPNQFGWIKIRSNKIKNITCKKKASTEPHKDLVIIGAFGFKNKKIFISSIKNIIEKNIRINNEFYLDVVIKNMFKSNLKISNILVKNFSSFGTPIELESSLLND